jgi:uncharacterized protein YraI
MGGYLRDAPSVEAAFDPIANVTLPIIGVSEDGAWYQVEYEGRTGWLRPSPFVELQGDVSGVPVIPTEAPPEVAAPVLIVSGMGGYLRDAPSVEAAFDPIANVTLPIIGVSEDGAWYQVEYEGRLGWVRRSSFVRVEGDLSSVPVINTEAPPEVAAPVLIVGNMGAYLRDAPSLDAPFEPISNEKLPIIGVSEDGAWYQVEYEGRLGWVRRSSFVRVEGDTSNLPIIAGAVAPAFLSVIFADDFEQGGLDERWYTWDGTPDIIEADGSQVLLFDSPGENQWTGAAPIPIIQGDYSVSFRAKIIRSQPEYGDVIINVRRANDIGIDSAIASEGDAAYMAYYTPEGWNELEYTGLTVDNDTWYLLRIDVVGEDIRLFVDGRQIISATQPGLGPGEIVTIATAPTGAILVDDVVIRSLDQATMDAAPQITVIANVNVRLYPGTDQAIISRAESGSRVFLIESSPDGAWVYMRQPETGVQGWISAEFVTAE